MKQRQVLPVIYKHLQAMNNHYLAFPQLEDQIADYIVTPGIEGFQPLKAHFIWRKLSWNRNSL